MPGVSVSMPLPEQDRSQTYPAQAARSSSHFVMGTIPPEFPSGWLSSFSAFVIGYGREILSPTMIRLSLSCSLIQWRKRLQ